MAAVHRGLRRVFWLMEGLKSHGKDSGFKARRVHVIGAGVMGGDIAAWCVLQGLEVTLQDREMKYIEPALKRAKKLFAKRLKTPDRIAGAQSRLIADVSGEGQPGPTSSSKPFSKTSRPSRNCSKHWRPG